MLVDVVELFVSDFTFFGCLPLAVVFVFSVVVVVSVFAGIAGSCAPNESAALPIISERPRAAEIIVFIAVFSLVEALSFRLHLILRTATLTTHEERIKLR